MGSPLMGPYETSTFSLQWGGQLHLLGGSNAYPRTNSALEKAFT